MQKWLFFFVLVCGLSAQALNQCLDPVPTEIQSKNDCQMRSHQRDWSLPEQAEWSRDIQGYRSGIVNLYLHGDIGVVRRALQWAGWTESLPANPEDNKAYLHAAYEMEKVRYQLHQTRSSSENTLMELLTAVENWRAPQTKNEKEEELKSQLQKWNEAVQKMPVSYEFLCGQPQITAFEQNNSVFGGRDHLRIFATNTFDQRGRPVWAVVANRDVGIIFDRHRPRQGFLNHQIEMNADLERDKVIQDILSSHLAKTIQQVRVNFCSELPPDQAQSVDRLIFEGEVLN